MKPEWATAQTMIDAASAEMCEAKTAALDAYRRIHPVNHQSCAGRCHQAKQQLDRAFSGINAAYQASLPRMN